MECDAFMRRIFCAMHKGIALLLHVNAKTPISNKVFVFFEKFLSSAILIIPSLIIVYLKYMVVFKCFAY